MTGRHSRGEDYARVLCCCGHRIVSMTWPEYRSGVPALCEHADCSDPDRELTRTTTARREGSVAAPQPTRPVSSPHPVCGSTLRPAVESTPDQAPGVVPRPGPRYQLRTSRPRAHCRLCDRPMSLTVAGTFRHHQHPRLLIPCRNSGRRPDQQLEPPTPPAPKPRGQRPVLDL